MTMKKKLNEHPVKTFARKMLREGELDTAEASLAAKDISDRIQDTVEEISKMLNDELPKLVDKIRSTFGQEQANAYQQTANSVLSELLEIVKEKKAALEQAVLVLTGDAQSVPGDRTELDLPDEADTGEDFGDEDLDGELEPEAGAATPPAPLGRAPRLPAEESRKFNKKLIEAKIIALKKALDETNTKKFPIRARRLAEELNRVAIMAIKEEATQLKKLKPCPDCNGKGPKQPRSTKDISCKTCKGFGKVAKNVKGSSKKMLAPVKKKATTKKK